MDDTIIELTPSSNCVPNKRLHFTITIKYEWDNQMQLSRQELLIQNTRGSVRLKNTSFLRLDGLQGSIGTKITCGGNGSSVSTSGARATT